MGELNSLIILCLVLELFFECKISEKYNQYFTFLLGMIMTTMLTGIVAGGVAKSPVDLQKKMEEELSNWQKYCEEYQWEEVVKKEELENVNEQYNKAAIKEKKEALTKELQDILSLYQCEIADIEVEGENECTLIIKKADSQEIKIEEIGSDAGFDSQKEEEIRSAILKRLKMEDDTDGFQILFQESGKYQ